MRDIATKFDGTSTLNAAEFNGSIMLELENSVTTTGITLDPAGGEDTRSNMLSEAITRVALSAQSYQDSGTANSYVLSHVGTITQPIALFNGMSVSFVPANENTGASTLNLSGLGAKKILLLNGNELSSGDLTTDKRIVLNYNPSADSGSGAWIFQPVSTDDENSLIGLILPNSLPTKPENTLWTDGGVFNREDQPELWAKVNSDGGDRLITESAWQTKNTAAAGDSVPYYSSGDGSTTFRIPKIVDFIRGTSATTASDRTLDGAPEISGDSTANFFNNTSNLIGMYGNNNTGCFSGDNTGRGTTDMTGGGNGFELAVPTLKFNASNSYAGYSRATEIQPKHVAYRHVIVAR